MRENAGFQGNMLERTDFLFSLYREKEPQRGEDSYLYALHEQAALLGAFGGLEAGTYPGLENRSGGYLASRAAAAGALNWFEGLENGQEPDPTGLKEQMTDCLRRCETLGGKPEGGGLNRRLPCAAALALLRPEGSETGLRLFWAGDSRICLLDGEGLAQLTEDDLGGADAMAALSGGGRLTNAVSLGSPFTLHTARLHLRRPALLFAVSKGCFAHFSTPMEFEYLLLESLRDAECAADWEKNLSRKLGEKEENDAVLSGLCLGFGSFDALKRRLHARTEGLFRGYINGLDACSPEEKQQLWEKYRGGYSRLLRTGDRQEAESKK